MRRFLIAIASAAAAFAAAAPADAQPRPVATAPAYHRNALEMALTARLEGIQRRIQLLREEDRIDSEEARELRQQSRILERRLIGLTARDASDVELSISRLRERVTYAADESRWSRHVFDEDEDARYEADRLEARRQNSFQVDRHVAPPVDRWHDPFDRGNEF